MIKDTFILFLSHQQQTLRNEESINYNNRSTGQILNEQQSEIERETHAAEVVQVKYSISELLE
jgi:hypothetical protein